MIKKQTCEELGVCKQRAECHLPCSGPSGPKLYPFAPGVIDGPVPDPDAHWAEVVALAIVLGALGALAAAIGFATGYLNLPGWLP